MKPLLPVLLVLCSTLIASGCRDNVRQDLSYDYNVLQTWTLDEWGGTEIVQFETVAWAPEQTIELRRLIAEENIAQGRTVLEIGTGTGVLSLLCAWHGADKVVATDSQPAAVACARYNAANQHLEDTVKVRQADAQTPDAFSAIADDESFDLILMNLPLQDAPPSDSADNASEAPDPPLLRSLLDGLPQHLKPSGRCLVSVQDATTIRNIQAFANEQGWTVSLLDQRELDSLPSPLWPPLIVEIKLPIQKVQPAKVQSSEVQSLEVDASAERADKETF